MPLDTTAPDSGIIEIAISRVIHRVDLYPRLRHDPLTVQRYASLTTQAPPISVNQLHELIDGRHRCLAALERGESMIPAIIVPTRDDQHLLGLAVDMNFDHGLALSQDDKKRLAVLRYNPSARHLNDQKLAIAEWLRVDPRTIYRWLEAADHRRRQLRHDRIRELAAQHVSQHKIAAALDCSVGLVNNFLRSDSDNRQKLDTLPAGFVPELYDDFRFTSKSDDGIEHFGRTDPRILDNLIWRYAPHQHNAVLDVFSGSGVSVDVCRNWGRTCYAFDRLPRPARMGDIQKHDILTDGLLPEVPDWGRVSLCFLDPPYAKQAENQYSNDPTDLAHLSFDEFERVLSDLINELGTVLPSGAAICLLIRNTQWHSPGHRIRRHDRNIENLVTLEFEREIYCALGKESTTTVRQWAEATRDCLVVSRKLLIWRV